MTKRTVNLSITLEFEGSEAEASAFDASKLSGAMAEILLEHVWVIEDAADMELTSQSLEAL